MNELKKIQYNCQKATFLIEKKYIGTITLKEKLELRIHLAGCSICKIFMQQSAIINQMMHGLFNSPDHNEAKLDEKFKKNLQERIDEHLDQ